MSIKKRGKHWYIDFSFQGKRYRKSVGPITKSEATKIETRIRQELIDNYSRRLQGKKDLYSFGEALLRWLKGEAPESMFHHIRAVRPYLENVELSKCVEAVEHMKDEFISKGLAVSTINRRLAVVKRVLNLAYRRWDMLEYPLAEKIEKYSEKGLERNVFLNIDDVEKIINFISDEEVRKAILGYCVSGMRKGELLSLSPGDFQDGCVHLKKQKNSKFSVIPIPSDFHFLFDELPFKATADKIRWHWEKARTLAEMEHVRIHDLRHSYASWLAADPNISLTTIRDMLRHSSLAMTNRYAHLNDKVKRQAAEDLGTQVKKMTQLVGSNSDLTQQENQSKTKKP